MNRYAITITLLLCLPERRTGPPSCRDRIWTKAGVETLNSEVTNRIAGSRPLRDPLGHGRHRQRGHLRGLPLSGEPPLPGGVGP